MNRNIIIICIILLIIVGSGMFFIKTRNRKSAVPSQQNFYVDVISGNDNADGLSYQSAWQSIEKVNSVKFRSGSKILFKKGGVWRGQLKLASGVADNPIIYGSYGDATEKPLILGSLNKGNTNDWIQEVGNVWKSSSAFETDVGNLIFNGGSAFGEKKWDVASLINQGDYWLDKSSKILHIYSVGNPAIFYSDIEAALRKHIIDQEKASYVTVDGLALKYGAAHGIGGGKTHHITIKNMDISYIGGGDLRGDSSNVRFGNGIEFWSQAHDNMVEGNKIWEIYDTCLSNQNNMPNVKQYNITYKNNVMWNCGLASFEYWNKPESSQTYNIIFENNTAVNAGYSWGNSQRPDRGGAHILTNTNTADTKSIYISNNIFYKAKDTAIGMYGYDWAKKGMTIDNNCWYQSNPEMKMAELYDGPQPTIFTVSQFKDYQLFTNKDAVSIIADPLFFDISSSDFRLKSDSPCIGRGAKY